MPLSTTRARGWWRALFIDHPGVASRAPESFAGAGDEHKVWCRKCFDARVSSEILNDEAGVTAGMRTSVRDQQTIENTCVYPTISDVFRLFIIFLT